MNERIRELLLKAGWDRYEALDERNQKFAELLLKECAQIAVFKDSDTVATADVAGHMAAGRSIAARLIREHFGVDA
jgi:hypothetical protein